MPEFHLFLKTEARNEVAHALATVVSSDEVVASGSLAGVSWLAQEYRVDNSPLVYCVNIRIDRENKRLSLASANPVGSLSEPMVLRVERVEVNEEAGEALVMGRLMECQDLPIHIFMPWFFLGGEESVVVGAELSFRLCALALKAETLRETLIELRQGPFYEDFLAGWLLENPEADPASAPPVEIDLSQLRAFLPDAPDVAEFQLPSGQATRLESPFGAEVWHIEDYFIQMDGVNRLKLPLHIPSARNPNYDPAAELPVRGQAWILGFLEGKAPGDFTPVKTTRKKTPQRQREAGSKTAKGRLQT